MIEHYQTLGPRASDQGAVMLVLQAAYHLAEFLPLREELQQRGIAAEVIAPVPPRKPLNRLRPGVWRHVELLAASDAAASDPQPVESIVERANGLVVMNDWGVTRPLAEEMKHLSRPTLAWVEGVQDSHDVDTGRSRLPYSTVDHVFCLGRHDVLG